MSTRDTGFHELCLVFILVSICCYLHTQKLVRYLTTQDSEEAWQEAKEIVSTFSSEPLVSVYSFRFDYLLKKDRVNNSAFSMCPLVVGSFLIFINLCQDTSDSNVCCSPSCYSFTGAILICIQLFQRIFPFHGLSRQ